MGRAGDRLPEALRAAAAVSPPLDLAACAAAIDAPANRLYQAYFMRSLRASYAERQRLLPDLYAPGSERGLTTIRAYDEAITAPYNGFADAADYYAQSSAGPHVASIRRPTLILAAEDDPMVPGPSVSRWPLPASGVVAARDDGDRRPRRFHRPHGRAGALLGGRARDALLRDRRPYLKRQSPSAARAPACRGRSSRTFLKVATARVASPLAW